MAEQFTIPTPGDIIAGKYLIQEELGRGSYGVVFRARHLGVERDVALKTLLPQAFLQTDIVERFQREASMVSRLTHPNIVTLYDFGESDGVLYMAMEFIRGKQLSHIIKEESPLGTERALHIVRQVLAALQVAHKKGIVHRDLKPENIILCDAEEARDVVKVLDFGIAKMTESDEHQGALKTLTIQGYVLGTPHYMSPETITGDPVDNRADLYAVGLLLYEMLTGSHPFNAPKPSAVLMKHLSEPVPPLPDPSMESSHIGYALRLALAKAPDDRMDDAESFIEILDGLQEPPVIISEGWFSSTQVILICAGVLAVALIAWGLVSLMGGGGQGAGADAGAIAARDAGSAPVARRDVGVSEVAVAAPQSAEDVGVVAARPDVPVEPVRVSEIPDVDKKPVEVVQPRQVGRTVLRFVSQPTSAQVIVNGSPVGATPCTAVVQGEDPVKVLIKKIGYRPRSLTISPKGTQQSVSVKLKPGRIKLSP